MDGSVVVRVDEPSTASARAGGGAACEEVHAGAEAACGEAHAGAEAAYEEALASTSLQVLHFEDTDEFYDEFIRICTEGAPFSVRIPFVKLSQFPGRLKDLVKASAHSSGVELWTKAFESQRECWGDGDGEAPERTFTIYLERHFHTDIEDTWSDYDAFVQENDVHQPRIVAPLPGVAPTSAMLRAAGHIFYGTRYGLAWAVKQDRKRWRWMLGLTAAGAGAGVAAGFGLGAAVGATAGLATGVVTSGRRKATVVVNRQGASISCP